MEDATERLTYGQRNALAHLIKREICALALLMRRRRKLTRSVARAVTLR